MQAKARKEKLDWNEFHLLVKGLVKKIRKSGFVPEVIIAISRGGLVPGTVISHEFGNKGLYTVKAEYYKSERFSSKPESAGKKPLIAQGLGRSIQGKKVLVVDEILDSGKTMTAVIKYLKRKKPKDLRVAVMHSKPWASFKPDYEIRSTANWIVYPWEKK